MLTKIEYPCDNKNNKKENNLRTLENYGKFHNNIKIHGSAVHPRTYI